MLDNKNNEINRQGHPKVICVYDIIDNLHTSPRGKKSSAGSSGRNLQFNEKFFVCGLKANATHANDCDTDI